MNTPELQKISKAMLKIVSEIGEHCEALDKLGEKKAIAVSAYDKAVAIKTIQLASKHPATLMDKIVKGECVSELYDKLVAESAYKACISKLEARKAQLTAFQSLYRHQETV